MTSAAPERRLNDAERGIAAVRARCNLWELTPAVCELACHVAPGKPLGALDTLHLATFVLASRRITGWKYSRSNRDYAMRPVFHNLGGTLAPGAGRWRSA